MASFLFIYLEQTKDTPKHKAAIRPSRAPQYTQEA